MNESQSIDRQRFCEYCDSPLVQRNNEKKSAFRRRRFCNRQCVRDSNGRALRKFPCPFSSERLHELYWKEGKTLLEIAILAQSIEEWEFVPRLSSVHWWLKKVGIKCRNYSENSQLPQRIASSLENLKVAQAKVRRLASYGLYVGNACNTSALNTRRVQRKSLAARKRRLAEELETRLCCNPDCNMTLTRRPKQFRGKFWFCSPRCTTIAYNAQRRGKRFIEPRYAVGGD